MFQWAARRLLKRRLSNASEAPIEAAKKQKSDIFKPLVWIDCEMTGLDIKKDHIIEICCIITDGHLNVIDAEGYESTVYVPKKVLDLMNEWCVNQHGKSGLTAKVLANPKQTLAKVEAELLAYIKQHIPQPRSSLLAGNSVHMDKFFMMKEFPSVIDHLHYRLVDVSSVMEIGFRHNPELMKKFPKKQGSHTARSDILESIAQLKWYRDNYLRGPEKAEPKEKAEQKVEPKEETEQKEEVESTEEVEITLKEEMNVTVDGEIEVVAEEIIVEVTETSEGTPTKKA